MDVHSIIADPQFMNPAASDFRLRNNAVADKIGFKPFALDRSGVYGSPEWRKRAEISPEMSSAFDNTVSAAEKEKAPGKK